MYSAHGGSLVDISALPYLLHSSLLLRYLLHILHPVVGFVWAGPRCSTEWMLSEGGPNRRKSILERAEGQSQRSAEIKTEWGGTHPPIHTNPFLPPSTPHIQRILSSHCRVETKLRGQTATMMFMSKEYESSFSKGKAEKGLGGS